MSGIPLMPLGHNLSNGTGVVHRQRERACVRRMYAARVEGRKSSVMVAMYQGNGAEEARCILFSRYSLLTTFAGMTAGYCEIYVGSASVMQPLHRFLAR